MGCGLLSDTLHQLFQALDAARAAEDDRFVILPVRVLLGIEHELEGLGMLVQIVEHDVVRAHGLMTGAHGEVECDPTLALYPAVDELRADLPGRVREVETEVVLLAQVRKHLDQEVRPLSRRQLRAQHQQAVDMRVHDVCQVVEDHAFGDSLDYVSSFSVIEARLNDVGRKLMSHVEYHGRKYLWVQARLLVLFRRTHVCDPVLERARNENVAYVSGGIGQNQVTGTKSLVDPGLLLVGESNQLGRRVLQPTDVLKKYRTYRIELVSKKLIGLADGFRVARALRVECRTRTRFRGDLEGLVELNELAVRSVGSR